jgi:hypothetical protein
MTTNQTVNFAVPSDPGKIAIVITSIAEPNPVLQAIARGSIERGIAFYVIGDTKSPKEFVLHGCDFYSVERQRELGFQFAQLCPTRHYARKNIGYLQAIREGATILLETDDDNYPEPAFYQPLPVEQSIPSLRGTGWVNLYRYYTDLNIWPRGLPLDAVNTPLPPLSAPHSVYCPIQQGLADDNPDVDAIYRLVMPLPVTFQGKHRLAIEKDAWCPFNSQNTVFYEEAFPLLYLPAHCSFRMTDIWRSFVAQRIAWENGWSILFREATVRQLRNDHRLMKDFEDEISGYLHNRRIGEALQAVQLTPGVEHIPANLRRCYETLVENQWVGEQELQLLDAWNHDIASLKSKREVSA